jgi:hypothetical protein
MRSLLLAGLNARSGGTVRDLRLAWDAFRPRAKGLLTRPTDLWIETRSLVSGKSKWIPRELIDLGFNQRL